MSTTKVDNADDMAESSRASRPNKSTTFENLPPELRNRIYELAGVCCYFEEPVHACFRHSVSGEYCVEDHSRVHGCTDGAACPFAPWDGYLSWSRAAILVNPANHDSTRHREYPHRFSEACRPGAIHRLLPHLKTARKPQRCYDATTDQPAITRVNKFLREDTLSIFYGGHPFIFRLLSSDSSDRDKILRFLDTIGPDNASRLEEVHVVYARRQQKKEIEKDLLREMRARGVVAKNGDASDVVRLTRLAFPFSQLDSAVHDAVTKARGLRYRDVWRWNAGGRA